MNPRELREQIRKSEGERRKPYTDTTGDLTIGVGRNLSAKGISKDEMEYLFQNDLNDAIEGASELFVNLFSYSEARQHALIEMVFNLGKAGVLGFTKMRAAIRIHDWEAAAKEALDSKWAEQVGGRAKRIAEALRDDSQI